MAGLGAYMGSLGQLALLGGRGGDGYVSSSAGDVMAIEGPPVVLLVGGWVCVDAWLAIPGGPACPGIAVAIARAKVAIILSVPA